MESNNDDNDLPVVEKRTEVENKQEAGKLSVVSGIDENGNLKTTEAKAANQASFLKLNSKDGLLKNFMKMKAYQPIPTIADFTNEEGSDNLKETIEANYKRVRQEVLSLVDTEIERIKADPALRGVIKDDFDRLCIHVITSISYNLIQPCLLLFYSEG